MDFAPDIAAHPLLHAVCFRAHLPRPLGELAPGPALTRLLALDAEAPLARDEERRKRVRDLLRHGGYKPTGRGKPSSEYLVRAAGEGALNSINVLVDACNASSLHSGLPISVVDEARTVGALRIDIAPEGSRYVFNPSGQEIDASGLLCLFDTEGPCANAVKDAQRTKTGPETRSAVVVVWGLAEEPEHADATAAWYRELLSTAGIETEALD